MVSNKLSTVIIVGGALIAGYLVYNKFKSESINSSETPQLVENTSRETVFYTSNKDNEISVHAKRIWIS